MARPGIYISPYAAHSWVPAGTSATMQTRPYLYSSGLCEARGAGGLLFQSQQTKTGGWGVPGGLVGRQGWVGKRDQVFVTSVSGRTILNRGNLDPKGAGAAGSRRNPD